RRDLARAWRPGRDPGRAAARFTRDRDRRALRLRARRHDLDLDRERDARLLAPLRARPTAHRRGRLMTAAAPPDGPLATRHPNGELASRGTLVAGKLEGTFSRFTSSTPGGEPLRDCCVPPGARELRARYRAGQLLDEVFYDAAGRPLCSDGAPWPERAP